jgi:hypothetical protein
MMLIDSHLFVLFLFIEQNKNSNLDQLAEINKI